MSHLKNSCGAIFYSFDPQGVLGIILGDEGDCDNEEWLPFKGCAEENEPFEEAAKREIKEESGGLVIINNIVLEHKFATKRKTYHIGVIEVPYGIIEEYNNKRNSETRKEYKEKKKLKFFPLNSVLHASGVHSISRASINYYTDRLKCLAVKPFSNNELLRNQAISLNEAKRIKERCSDSDEENETKRKSCCDIEIYKDWRKLILVD